MKRWDIGTSIPPVHITVRAQSLEEGLKVCRDMVPYLAQTLENQGVPECDEEGLHPAEQTFFMGRMMVHLATGNVYRICGATTLKIDGPLDGTRMCEYYDVEGNRYSRPFSEVAEKFRIKE